MQDDHHSKTNVSERKMGRLTFIVVHLLFWCECSGVQGSSRDARHDFSDMFDDCTSKAAVVVDKATMQKWDACQANFSQSWSSANQNTGALTHRYMEKHHSVALYMYIETMLQSAEENTDQQKTSGEEVFEPYSLYSSLSEAIQILRHSQVTCLHTNYRTETPLSLNISNQQLRFSVFTLGLKTWNSSRGVSCFKIYSCFGADVTPYSSLKHNTLALVPPYEVFKVTDIQKETKECQVIYTLKSNMNCVFDRSSNDMHQISVLPVQGFWFIFIFVCFIIIFLVLICVIVKVCHKKTGNYTSHIFVSLEQIQVES